MRRHSYPFPQTVTALAHEVGVGRVHLSGVLAGAVRPSVDLAKAIEAATHGAVRAVDLLGLSDLHMAA